MNKMFEQEQQKRKVYGSDNTMGLFVSLYLILLAFFIVMNSMADAASENKQEALDSVAKTFKNSKKPTKATTAQGGEAIANGPDPILNDIAQLVTSELDVTGSFPQKRTDIFRVDHSVDSLFERGSFQVHFSKRPFIKNLSKILLSAPAGEKTRVSFLFGTDGKPTTDALTRREEIAVRRAGALARTLRGAGMVDGTFNVGFAGHSAATIIAVYQTNELLSVAPYLRPIAQKTSRGG